MKHLTGWPLTIATCVIVAMNVVVVTADNVPEWLRIAAAAAVAVGAVLGISQKEPGA